MRLFFSFLFTGLLLFQPLHVSSQFLSSQSDDILSIQTDSDSFVIYSHKPASITFNVFLKENWHINANKPRSTYLIPTVIDFELPDGIYVKNIRYPAPLEKKFSFSTEPVLIYENNFTISASVIASDTLVPGTYPAKAIVHYQPCDDLRCLPPDEKSVFLMLEVHHPVLHGNEKKPAAKENFVTKFAGKGLILKIIALFIAGLALNLTPCVYPLIPITISYFSSRDENKKPVRAAFLYLLGISFTYSILGTFAGLTGMMFGSVLQNKWVLIMLAGLMLVLAAGMFELFSFQPPAFLMNRAGKTKNIFGCFGMGIAMGIIAAPCIGPFVVGLLAYIGQRQSALLGFLCFFVLSLGLGTPYLFLAIFSNRISSLPKSGDWMVWVKSFFGFVLIGMAVYFINPLITKDVTSYLVIILLIISGIYLGFVQKLPQSTTTFKTIRKTTGIILILSSMVVIPFNVKLSDTKGIKWLPYSEPNLRKAITGNHPVLLDFYADWCIPCVELDYRTFSDKRVQEALKDFMLIKVDLTLTGSVKVKKISEKYSISGVPTLIFLDKNGIEIPGLRIIKFIPPERMLEIIKKI